MKRLLVLACALLSFPHPPAQAQRWYQPAELESLLAPIALYPDALIAEILEAATHPVDVIEAARRPNTENPAWHPSVQMLLAFPEILERMASSASWMFDLGNAYLAQAAQVMDSVQTLRQRAQASGNLLDTRATPGIVYLPYYNPLAVYGSWQPVYRVVYWRPWLTRRIFVTNNFHVTPHVRAPETSRQPISRSMPTPIALRGNGPPSPAAQLQAQTFAQRQPSVTQSMPPPIALSGNGPPSPAAQMQGARVTPPQAHHEHHPRERRESRVERPARRSPSRS